MKPTRVACYAGALALGVLALAYCVLVELSGRFSGPELRLPYLSGVPNYYLFYLVILPFVATGVIHLGVANRHIRFLGPIGPDLDARLRRKVRKLQRVLAVLIVLFGVAVVIQDAAEKDQTLAPFAFRFDTPAQERAVAEFYGCAQGWITAPCEAIPEGNREARYLEVLRDNGVDVATTRGFLTFSSWWQHSSRLYLFESLLSLLAAFVVGIFLAQVLLLVVVKDHARPATRDLIIWMLVLISFWFPAKIYSSWYSNLSGPEAFQAPVIIFFGLTLLVLGTLLVFFVRTERNNLAKFGSAIGAVFSFALAAVSYLEPQYIQLGVELLFEASVIYALVLVAVIALALYLVTDYFISSYEQDIDHQG